MLSRIGSGRQRGMSLVELLVGIAIGMFVVAAATLIVTTQLGENRRLLLETQLQQDLRATADIITRELRRAGSVGDPGTMSIDGIWVDGMATVTQNSFTEVDTDTEGEVQFRYRRGPGRQGPFGFKLEEGAIKTLLNEGTSWQELTDSKVMQVTAFTVTPQDVASVKVPCPKLCPATGDTSCWPTLEVRSYVVAITATAANDASIVRSISSRVRVRNDWLKFNDPDHPLDVCPA